MSGNEVRLANGRRWTAQQFLDDYLSPMGTPTQVGFPSAPVPVDMSWYMGEGPGRFYHPGMFEIVNQIMARRDLAPGTYNLWDLAPDKKDDNSVKASISNYTGDPLSADYRTRALVFGNESARISGHVDVDRNGSKTFKGVEIRSYNTDFNFKRKTEDEPLEAARALARKIYDPEERGV